MPDSFDEALQKARARPPSFDEALASVRVDPESQADMEARGFSFADPADVAIARDARRIMDENDVADAYERMGNKEAAESLRYGRGDPSPLGARITGEQARVYFAEERERIRKRADDLSSANVLAAGVGDILSLGYVRPDADTQEAIDLKKSESLGLRMASGLVEGGTMVLPVGAIAAPLRGLGPMVAPVAAGTIYGAARKPTPAEVEKHGEIGARAVSGVKTGAFFGAAGSAGRALAGAAPSLKRAIAAETGAMTGVGSLAEFAETGKVTPEHAIENAALGLGGALQGSLAGIRAERRRRGDVREAHRAAPDAERAAVAEAALKSDADPVAAVLAHGLGRERIERVQAGEEAVRSGGIGPMVAPVRDAGAPAEARSVPAEPVASPAKPDGPLTSIKNRVTNEERIDRGAPEMDPAERRGWDAAKADAFKQTEENPSRPADLARELSEKSRPLTDTDAVLLNMRRVDLHKARRAAEADVLRAGERGDKDALADAQQRIAENSDAFLQLEQATRSGGTESARGLAIRRAMAAEDYSLVQMETTRRVANDGKRLTPQQAAETRVLSEKLNAAIAERDAYRAKWEAANAPRKVPDSRKKPPVDVPISAPEYGATNRLVTRATYEATLASVKARLAGRLSANPFTDPGLIADAVKIGTFHVEAGARSFGRWAKAMVETVGEEVRPHLRAIWDESSRQAAPALRLEATDAIKSKLNEGVQVSDLAPLIQRVTEGFVRSGIKDRNALIDAVHGALKEADPNITRRQTMDAISGYGKVKHLNPDEAKAQLRELKGQMLQIAKLEDMAAGTAPLKTGLERQSPGDAQRELIRLVNEAKKEGGFSTPDPETALKSALDSLKTRMRNQIKDLEKRVASGKLEVPKRTPIHRDAEAVRLEAQLETARGKWHEALARDRLRNRPIAKKVFDVGVRDPIDLSRAMMTGLDISAVGRQGLIASLSHPIQAARAMVPMFRAIRSAEGQARVEAQIKLDPNYHSAKKAGVRFSEHNAVDVTAMEEAMRSRLATRIPGLAGLQRGFTTYLNRLRMDLFNTFERSLSRTGEATPNEARNIASLVNVMTGRGGPTRHGKLASAMDAATIPLFSPRLLASRIQWLSGQPFYGGSARTRKIVAEQYARFAIGAATIYAVGALLADDIETDPRSSDFGKVRFGETRLDPMGGLLQTMTLGARLGTGETKETTSGRVKDVGGDRVIGRFLRTKLAPIPGALMDLAARKDFKGDPVTPGSAALNLVEPMSVDDIRKAIEEQGVPRGVALGILSLLGMGLQTHEPKRRPAKGQSGRTEGR